MAYYGDVRTNRELWGKAFSLNGEWDAGVTNPQTPRAQAGRWFIRRETNRFALYFHFFFPPRDRLLSFFPDTDDGERAAKTEAIIRRDREDRAPTPAAILDDGRVPGLRAGTLVRVWKSVLGREYSAVGPVVKMQTDKTGQELIFVDGDWWVNANGLEDTCVLIAPPED